MWETSFLQSIPSHSLFQYLYLDISNPWQISQFFFYILRYQGLTVFNICLFISCTLPSLPSFPLPNYFKPSACYISCLIKIKENIQFNKSHILVSTTCICVVCFRSWGLSRGWCALAPLTNRSSSMSYIFCTHKKQTLKSRPWWRKSMIDQSGGHSAWGGGGILSCLFRCAGSQPVPEGGDALGFSLGGSRHAQKPEQWWAHSVGKAWRTNGPHGRPPKVPV